jgi:transketolase
VNRSFERAEDMARDVRRLERVCRAVRRDLLDMFRAAGSGHPGGSFSCVEILVALFFSVMRVRPEQPDWMGRDRFVLSKGHAAPALYAVLAERGFFPREELLTFSANGSRLQKHIDMRVVPGADLSTGSLGQGLSAALGMCLADRIDGIERWVYALLGDGESQEGQIWEAAMCAGHFRPERLVAFLDLNGCQVDGYVRDICDIEPVERKWRSFRWEVQRVNGHSLGEILAAVRRAKTSNGPHLIVADTVKGKGVSFMENKVEWHAKALSEDEYLRAVAEIGDAACGEEPA